MLARANARSKGKSEGSGDGSNSTGAISVRDELDPFRNDRDGVVGGVGVPIASWSPRSKLVSCLLSVFRFFRTRRESSDRSMTSTLPQQRADLVRVLVVVTGVHKLSFF